MNLFGTLNTATTGMNAAELSLQTATHNIANVNNPNYSRQRVELKSLPSMHMAGIGDIGMGTKASSVQRIVNEFVQTQLNQVNSSYNQYSQRSEVLGQLEGYYNEPSDNGILSQIDKLNGSFTSLANDPSSAGVKTTVMGNAKTVMDSINQLSNNISGLEVDTVEGITKNALDFNQTVKQLDLLNRQIYNITDTNQNERPNDLLDSRDELIQKLTGSADMTATFDKYGRVTLNLNNNGSAKTVLDAKNGVMGVVSVVASDGKNITQATSDMTTQTTITVPSKAKAGDVVLLATNQDGIVDTTKDASNIAISTGTIKGNQDALQDIKQQIGDLNKFAYQLATTTNTLMTANGVGTDKVMYTFSGGVDITKPFDNNVNYAANIKVNNTLLNDPTQLKSGVSDASGDGKLALAIANLQNEKLEDPTKGDPKLSADKLSFEASKTGSTVSGMFNNLVAKNGIINQAAKNNASSQLALLQQVQAKQQGVSGVNMNEEMSNVIKFQQGFQANAKLISVINQMLETLINRTGV